MSLTISALATRSLRKRAVSLLCAGVLALGLGCSGAGARVTESTFQSTSAPSGTPVAVAPTLADPAPAAALPAIVADPAAVSEGAAATPARKSPMQALNQMVTAQALLVSLLLAPLSKDATAGPLARVDAAPASAATH